MIVWILNHYAVPPDLPGGARHHELARQLVQRGHEVVVFASAFHHFGRRAASTRLRAPIERINGVTWMWIPTRRYRGNDWRRVLGMCQYLLRSLRLGRRRVRVVCQASPDVVVGSSVHLLAVLAAYILARRHGARFVMEVRDLWPQTLVEMGALPRWHPVVGLLRVLEVFLYRRAERVVTVLPHASEYIGRYISAERVVWIPNGVDPLRFDPTPRRSTIAGDTLRVGYLGAHGTANALEDVLDAADVLRRSGASVSFEFIGDGPQKAALVARARSQGITNVAFLDPVPMGEVPAQLARMDVCVAALRDLPLYRHGVALNKLVDYMAAGRPIVFSGAPANDVVSEAGCGVTVPAGDPAALARAIRAVADMTPRQREALGERGRRYVEEHLSWERLATMYEEVLQGP